MPDIFPLSFGLVWLDEEKEPLFFPESCKMGPLPCSSSNPYGQSFHLVVTRPKLTNMTLGSQEGFKKIGGGFSSRLMSCSCPDHLQHQQQHFVTLSRRQIDLMMDGSIHLMDPIPFIGTLIGRSP